MGLSIVPMNVVSLAEWLAAHATEYATVEEAITAGNLALQTGGPGLAGTALRIVGGAGSSAVDAAVTAENIIDFAAAQQAAATGAEVTTSAIGAVETASGGAKLAGVLGVELGTVAAAVAPLLGVGLGINLYESNPDFWTKLSQKLLPFCWPDTTKIPSWAEVFENTWVTTIPKKVYDAIKDLFDEEGIGVTRDTVEYITTKVEGDVGPSVQGQNLFPLMSCSGLFIAPAPEGGGEGFEESVKGFAIREARNNEWTIANVSAKKTVSRYTFRSDGSKHYQNVNLPEQVTFQGKTAYYSLSRGYVDFGSLWLFPKNEGIIEGTTSYDYGAIGNLAWYILYGNTISQGSAYYPAGTSQWTGNTPSEIPDANPAWISPTQTEPTIQVAFPPEIVPYPQPTPGVQPTPQEIPNTPSADPEEFPDPEKVTDPNKQVDPHIMPTPVPWETFVPEPQPNPDPNLDPAKPLPPGQEVKPFPFDIVPFPDGIVPFPDAPTTPLPFASNVGLVTVYHPTPTELYNFERWLWVTYQDAEIQKIWNNPFDGVISLFELYCTPTDTGRRNIHSGFLDSGIESAVISRYTEINCGTMSVPEYYGNYLDYSPYTRCYIYLPFIGVQELNADDIVGHAVNVTYRIDEYNGSCIAMITVSKVTEVNGEQKSYSNIMYQFSGNCAVELPLSGGTQAQIKAGMMTANAYQQASQVAALGQLLGGIGSILSTNPLGGLIGGLSGAAATSAYGQAQAVSNMVSNKAIVAHSGSFGSSHGALGVKKPFITVVRPKQVRVPNYNELYGFPAHKQVIVGNCTGFLRCLEVHVISATATDEEKSIIESMMKSGVYVTE